jgi:hypothetical protein
VLFPTPSTFSFLQATQLAFNHHFGLDEASVQPPTFLAQFTPIEPIVVHQALLAKP